MSYAGSIEALGNTVGQLIDANRILASGNLQQILLTVVGEEQTQEYEVIVTQYFTGDGSMRLEDVEKFVRELNILGPSGFFVDLYLWIMRGSPEEYRPKSVR